MSEVPAHDYSRCRKLLGKRFPKLGYYNIASTISINFGETDLVTGDAIDDLADIANELSELVWRSLSCHKGKQFLVTARLVLTANFSLLA